MVLVPEEPFSIAEPGSRARPRELAMSAAWHAGFTRKLTTTNGEAITVVFQGNWTHGFGPDFAGAMLDFGEHGLRTGAVEIHTRASDWIAHGHHLDERYNAVVLHIVTTNDLPETRSVDGKIVPVALLTVADDVLFALDQRLPDIWAELGGSFCAADISKRYPQRIRAALHRLGDDRLASKVAGIEGMLAEAQPEDVLLELLFDGFGYSNNRGPMRQLAQTLTRYGTTTHPAFPAGDSPPPALLGVMLGIAGFLPFSPAEAHAGGILPEDQYRIERCWQSSPAAFANDMIPATAWHMGRVRPANHPVSRIMQAATLLVRTGGQPATFLLDALREEQSLVELLRTLTARPGHPGLGAGRATAMAASVVIPFAMAWAAQYADANLEDIAVRTWGSLKHVEWTQPGKRALRQITGGPGIRGIGERGHQGLLHLDRTLCAPRRCYECPIAAEVIRDRSTNPE